MEGILKLNKSKFYNKSIRFVISFLFVSFCISGVRCAPGTYGPYIVHEGGISPLPENQGRWSKEEVDTVIDAIATAAKPHGFKKHWWDPDRGITLSGKSFDLSLDACFLYDKNGRVHECRFGSLWRKPNIQKERGTIWLSLKLEAPERIINSDRLLAEKIWHEVLDSLRNKFGERLVEFPTSRNWDPNSPR
jgi:hypothetical protein